MKINLLRGDNQPRSLIASAQRRLNVYAEATDPKQGEPGEMTHYPTPGLRLLGTTPNAKPIRQLYRASNGDLYCVAGFDVYYLDPSFVFHSVGSILSTTIVNPTKMADNGASIILCDGTVFNGWSINMASRGGMSPLFNPRASDALTDSSTGWLGSTFVDYTDGFFVANFIGKPTFYISNAQDTIFDPLQFASKNAYPDALIAAVVQHRVIWLIGSVFSEVWYNSGGANGGAVNGNNFPFELMPGVAIDWGCAAPYSIAKAETSILWLAQNQNGEVVVLRGSGYSIARISTHPIEHIFSTYTKIDDCVAYCYLEQGHTFYVMNFPSADATWVYDLATAQWHQRAWLDNDGQEHRQRPTCHAYAYNTNVVNDWQNGNLYALELSAFTDNGAKIKRLIGFPRQIDTEDDHRLVFRNFTAELDVGQTMIPGDNPLLVLSWSDDKGKTWSDGLEQSLGRIGEFSRTVIWNRLGISRNRVFRLEWSSRGEMALQAAFVTVVPASS